MQHYKLYQQSCSKINIDESSGRVDNILHTLTINCTLKNKLRTNIFVPLQISVNYNLPTYDNATYAEALLEPNIESDTDFALKININFLIKNCYFVLILALMHLLLAASITSFGTDRA